MPLRQQLLQAKAFAEIEFWGGGGEGTPRNFGWGCALPLPYFRPQYVIFPTLFQTWPKIPYPISDHTLPYFVQNVFKLPTIIKPLAGRTGQKWSKSMPYFSRTQQALGRWVSAKRVAARVLVLRAHSTFKRLLRRLPYFRPKRLKNHTLWGSTYLYGLYKGVHLPPGLNQSDTAGETSQEWELTPQVQCKLVFLNNFLRNLSRGFR